MPDTSRFLLALCAITAAAQEAPKPQLTARELFYSAASEKAPAPPAAPKEAPKSSPAKRKPAPPPTAKTAAPEAAPMPTGQHTRPIPLPAGGLYIQASTAAKPATGTPLGLRYTILRKSGDDMVEVAPDAIFHAGDRIQIRVQTNDPGYLYIISQGSSGTWKPMFPSPEVADGNNHVDGWNANTFPPKSRMVLDEQTGTERIFIVFSRTPEASLENIIYSLQSGGSKPKPEEKALPKQKVQIAMASIDNATVGHLRDVYARDLIIEKVDEKTAGDKKENAVYVVNPSGSLDSRIVADLKLVHQ